MKVLKVEIYLVLVCLVAKVQQRKKHFNAHPETT